VARNRSATLAPPAPPAGTADAGPLTLPLLNADPAADAAACLLPLAKLLLALADGETPDRAGRRPDEVEDGTPRAG
jgi:hypothetical protein